MKIAQISFFFITDDQSWVNTSFSGELAISTPGFDKIANEGIFFENAICASPSCSPSRGAIITGQEIWRLGEASQLFSAVPKELSKLCFPYYLKVADIILVTLKKDGPQMTLIYMDGIATHLENLTVKNKLNH